MLKLKRVEIQGFKSFCDRTEMRFNGAGIAAVVGPNGCGKSNLSDAISWVLGEQSAKSLRGARMEDVIFAGTRDRKPLGMASVTMTLADPQYYAEVLLPGNGQGNGNGANGSNGHSKEAHPQEITITRRLFRSGESEYLINGRQARLRDIQDIFMGTGLGPESYAIIEQGRIGQILSSKPQDRRSVIEEAAGITKFKARRRLAEAKLEGAKQNLTRVFDILEEVGRQVNSLKRQASKARRYEELKTEMLGHLRRSLTGRYRMLERDAAKTALDLNLATSEVHTLAAGLAAREAEQARLQEQCFATENELTRARARLAELRLDAERTRGRLESQARQIAGIEQRLGQGENETQDLDRRWEALGQEHTAAAAVLAQLQGQAEEARRRLAVKNEEREQVQGALRGREQALEAARTQVLRLLGEASNLKNQLAKVDEYLAGVGRDTARLERDEQAAAGDAERLGAAREEIAGRVTARQQELESIAGQRRTVEEELSTRRARAAETRRRMEQLRQEFSRMKARRDSLEEILSHRAYTTESVKRLFTAVERGQAQDLKPAGVLADFVEVDPAYEKAAEEFLHEELEYVVVKDWAEAERGIALMRSDLDGRATFLVHPQPGAEIPAGEVPEPAIGPETGIVSRLSAVLRLTNGLTQAPAELLPRLARCFLAEDRAAAQRLAVQYPDVYFLLADGVCYHGHAVSGGKKTGAGPLALKRELRELAGQVAERQKELDRASALAEDLELEIAALSEDLERLRGLQQSREKEAVALEHELRKTSEELNRSNSRLSLARAELERLRKDVERAEGQREELSRGVAEKEQARLAQERALEGARSELEGLQKQAAHIGEEHAVLRAELAGLEERRRSGQAAQSRLEAQIHELANRRRDLAAEMERLGVERARLLADNIELDDRAAALAGEIAGAESGVGALETREREERGGLAALEEALREMRVAHQAAQERRAQIELDLVKRQAELKYLEETCRKELNAALGELAQSEETVLDEDALTEAEARYQEVRDRIEALGPVNPSALEEYQEASQRYDFLNTQRQDLLDSIRDTEKAIQEIDVESRKRFSEAFEAINAHFRELFRTLFGGGTGEMRLTDETNLADSGIEIVAQPPGKRLQNVLRLSGGEKALTALALLMATFKYQPSPFCILDEVDAPLDEPNIERLTRLLKQMSAQTQFIVITHAKRTMESAQALYGVTMQEPGVSKLVSVRFQAPPEMPPPLAAPAPEPLRM
ncbi:MAG: chromosome segregation protein SMC [Acidobacteria bacterium]|nr:chromosome segregation protein SMC [Acidobacteriota bacterium]